jgi:NAD(P)-dependent dehydrogenase (short-subunit alcohol dehydrogenase family)
VNFQAVERTVDQFGRLNILVNNAAEQHVHDKLEDITSNQLERILRTNVFSRFYNTKAGWNLPEGSSIVKSTSVTAYRGSPQLIDYSAINAL